MNNLLKEKTQHKFTANNHSIHFHLDAAKQYKQQVDKYYFHFLNKECWALQAKSVEAFY